MKKLLPFILIFCICVGAVYAQILPPKQPYPLTVKQIHSGHSLTDPLFFPHWPGQFVNLVAQQTNQQGWQIADKLLGKSTVPGSPMKHRWENKVGFDAPDARLDIADWEVLCITERVPLNYEGGNSQQWYLDGIQEQKQYLSLFVNNAWTNGNNGNGAGTLLWTTWTNLDNSNGPWREMLDIQGSEFERMQDYANANRPSGATPVYIIPGHKMMARLYDDIQLGIVPGITNINQFFGDNIHTNELGAYAIAMIHYACIFNESPVGLPNNLLPNAPQGTPIPSPALATYLQTMIWDVVTKYPRTGVASTTSLDNEATTVLTVYPNPATDFIQIQTPNQINVSEITIRNNLGSIVYNGHDNKVSIKHLPAGIYFLTIGNQHTSFVKM
jgi:hypothetical protein